ncbi:hypothetical protein FKM82_014282 [Ascaphus truei]
MADSASESDTDGAGSSSAAMQTCSSSSTPAPGKSGAAMSACRREELANRLASLQQENKVLRIELETYRLKCKALQEENRDLRKASVTIQARAEQEEEFISNTLFKKIQALQKEKETLAVNYEKEEEFLTNELSRKLVQLQHEKAELEQHLEQEQEFQVNKLMKKIRKLENDTISKQLTLEQLRREKIDLENTLEQEQEALVNRLWKRMDKLEAEKRILQEKLDQPVSAPPSPRDISMDIDSPENMMRHIRFLKNEVERLKKQLRAAQLQRLSYASHNVGFTPPTSLTRAGMSYFNSPGLHVQHMGASHGITRPSPRRSNSPDKFKRPTPPPSPNTQTPVHPLPPPPPPAQHAVQSAASQSVTSHNSVHPQP